MIEILKISLIGFMFSALCQEQHSIFTWYGRLIEKLPWWLCKPLGGCYRCFVGQLSLWYFIIKIRTTIDFNYIVELTFFVSAGILVSMVYHKIYCLLK